MLKVSIVGYGNVGACVYECVEDAPDMELVSLVSSRQLEGFDGLLVNSVADIAKHGRPDVAIVCYGSKDCPSIVSELLKMGISTVDSYDIHDKIWDYLCDIAPLAKSNGASALISAGWDPGTDSLIRALFVAMQPKGDTYTNFGPGMSMGHSVAARKVEGVLDAVSITLPLGKSKHARRVYAIIKPGFDKAVVEKNILQDSYFCNDDTEVIFCDDLTEQKKPDHGVNLIRQDLTFDMRINNPKLTAAVLTAGARAIAKQKPDSYTLIDIPVVDLLPGDRKSWVKELV